MAILWKPTGQLDINTAPTDLPEQSDGNAIHSGAMVRCKNLKLDRFGIAELRAGSSLISEFAPAVAPELILEVAGHRYIFAGDELFYDEVLISDTVQCEPPEFSPAGGWYVSEQSVTITSDTGASSIFYTFDGSTPTAQSTLYVGPVTVPSFSWLKAIAIDTRGFLIDSEVTSEYYGLFAQNTFVTETEENSLITETDSDNITTEGP